MKEVRDHLHRFNEVWDQLFPIEQRRIVHLIIKRIDVNMEGIDITYQPNGIAEIYEVLNGQQRAS